MMGEAQAVGEAFGIRFRLSIEKRIAGAESIGAHKTSMLQDIEHGRATEIDALLGSVIELARLVNVPTPHLDAIYAVTKLLGETVARSGSGLSLTRERAHSELRTMSADRTLRGLIASGRDEAVAIAAREAPPLSYAGLRALIDRTVRSLNELGIGRGDRVAIVLPNGPEMATAFLCVASAATSAPLNPAYKQDEFEFYLEDLKAKALIVEAGSESPALRAAEKLGVAVITLDSGAASRSRRLPAVGLVDVRCVETRTCGSAGHRPHFAHLGHHFAAENRAAGARQHLDLGAQYRDLARAFGQ